MLSPYSKLFAGVLLLDSLASASSIAFKEDYPEDTFSVSYDSANQEVTFTITLKNTHYFGFGFGTSTMGTGNDMIMCTASSGSPTCSDMVSNGYATPTVDSNDNLTQSNSSSGDIDTYVITRALDTGDSEDYVIPLDTDFDFIWCLSVDTNDISQTHDYRQAEIMEIEADGEWEIEGYEIPDAAAGLAGTAMASAIVTALLAFA